MGEGLQMDVVQRDLGVEVHESQQVVKKANGMLADIAKLMEF